MICPKCSAENDDEYVFCLNCGTPLPGGGPKTERIPVFETAAAVRPVAPQTDPVTLEIKTVEPRRFVTPNPATGYQPQPVSAQRKSRKWLFISLAAVLLLFAAGAIVGVVVLIRSGSSQVLPDHLGLFSVEKDRSSLIEIAKLEIANLLDARNNNFGITSFPVVGGRPEFILYAESTEIGVDDLKFVRLDSITDAGAMKHLPFQAAFVEGKRGMKTLRFSNGLPNGRYAFALFEGYLDEGRHKLWPFEVRGSNVPDSGIGVQEIVVAVKQKEVPPANLQPANTEVAGETKPASTPEIPVGARVAYCNATDVVVRNRPSLNARKINELTIKQKIYVISYSDNYDTWNGIQANWAYIQTEKGKRGWVFTPFISY